MRCFFPIDLKGTVSVISSDRTCKESNAQFTTLPLKHLYVLRIRDMCVTCVHFSKPPCSQLKIQDGAAVAVHSTSTTHKDFKGTFVNRALSSLNKLDHLKLRLQSL